MNSQASLSIPEMTEAFLLSRRIGNCTRETIRTYENVLRRFQRHCVSLATGAVHEYLSLRRSQVQPITLHKDYRTLRAFFSWAIEAGLTPDNPLAGLRMRLPRTLPRMPDDATVTTILSTCGSDWVGRRDSVIVALLADSALRRSEVVRLLVEDVNLGHRTLRVFGKGQKEDVGYFGARTAQAIRRWLAIRQTIHPEDPLICNRKGQAMSSDYITHAIYRLCRRAGLPKLWAPHALRHYAATKILVATGNLELVRQVLRHESLAMTLRYARLTGMEIGQHYRRASPLDRLDW